MHKAVAENYSKLRVLGSGIEYDYAGVVKDSLALRVGESFRVLPSSLWVIRHPVLAWC